MESLNLSAFLTFVVITTFTPGPNNITSSSMGVLYGYRRTLQYLLGIITGFFGIMLLSAFVSQTIYGVLPVMEGVMRFVGAGYILWLAYKTANSSLKTTDAETLALGYRDGMLLQVFNPKVWVYGLTIYTTFLVTITSNTPLLILSALFLACVGFCAISTWTLGGTAIKRFLGNARLQRAINIGLALLLVYTAIQLAGWPF
ncbi:MAG: LysE family transporter [Chloroflexota bacterium]